MYCVGQFRVGREKERGLDWVGYIVVQSRYFSKGIVRDVDFFQAEERIKAFEPGESIGLDGQDLQVLEKGDALGGVLAWPCVAAAREQSEYLQFCNFVFAQPQLFQSSERIQVFDFLQQTNG